MPGLKTIFMIFSLFFPNFGEEKVRPPDEDIVVLARRMLALNIEYSLNGLFFDKCRIKPTSGDTDIDAAACQLVESCVGQGNTIPDNVERCLKETLSDIRSGRSAFKFKPPSMISSAGSRKTSPMADIVEIQEERKTGSSQVDSVDAPNITVIAPTYPKAGRWRFITLTTSLSGSGVPSTPQSTEQCFFTPTAAKMLESMISSAIGGVGRGCHLSGLEMSNGRFRATRICIDRSGRSSVSIEGRYDSKRVDYREDEERVLMSRLPDGGTDRSVVRITTGEHVGDC